MNFETENIEFKSQFTEEIYKEVIAFANTNGGFLYIGIDDEGNAIGIDDVDEEYVRITNGIRDAIEPDVTMFVHYIIQDNNVVKIAVNEGTNKPYFLKRKGLKPNGVFVRLGSSSVPASFDQIKMMIKDSSKDVFEEELSRNQSLTFNITTEAFKSRNIDFDESKYLALGLTKNDLYTNLGYILSDQCEYTTKIAVFNDESCTEFRDRQEFGGSVFKQFDEAEKYLNLCNWTSSEIKGMYRTDMKDYPQEAVREALFNSLIHRDYSYGGSIIINVNNNKMEFITIGRLLPGLTIDDIKMGISKSRNEKLAFIFHRVGLIESYGTGIRRIYKLYDGCPYQPVIETSPNAFKITLPNMNAKSSEFSIKPVTTQMRELLTYLSDNEDATDEDIQKFLGVKKTRAFNILSDMRSINLIEVYGRGKDKRYRVR